MSARIEGCQSLTRVGDDRIEAVVRARIGPVKASFRGALLGLKPFEQYRMRVEAKGSAAGFGKGEASVTLAEIPEGTCSAMAFGRREGKLAQIGSRLIGAGAPRMEHGVTL